MIVLEIVEMLARGERESAGADLEDIVPVQRLDDEGVDEGEDGLFHNERDRKLSNKGREDGERGEDGCEFESCHKTSSYDPNFEQNLIDNSIYPDDYDFSDERDSSRPINENAILDRFRQSRSSLSSSQFSEKAFRSFKQKNSRALNEDAVMGDVFPLIQGDSQIPSAKNLVFENLESLTHGNFVDAKPDFYDGARPAQIDL